MQNILMVWDLDGTLIFCLEGRKAMELAFYELYGIRNAFEKVTMAGRLDAFIVREAFKENGIPETEIDSFFDTYCRILEEFMQDADQVWLLPGVKEILKNTSSDSTIHHALATGNIERGARIKLAPYDLNKYFPVGGFGDQELERWQIVDLAIKRAEEYYGVTYQKENIYVIGDTPRDIECGKILGIKSIAVATGPYDEEKLRMHSPDYLFPNLEKTEAVLKIFHK